MLLSASGCRPVSTTIGPRAGWRMTNARYENVALAAPGRTMSRAAMGFGRVRSTQTRGVRDSAKWMTSMELLMGRCRARVERLALRRGFGRVAGRETVRGLGTIASAT